MVFMLMTMKATGTAWAMTRTATTAKAAATMIVCLMMFSTLAVELAMQMLRLTLLKLLMQGGLVVDARPADELAVVGLQVGGRAAAEGRADDKSLAATLWAQKAAAAALPRPTPAWLLPLADLTMRTLPTMTQKTMMSTPRMMTKMSWASSTATLRMPMPM